MADDDFVTLRHPGTRQELRRPKGAVPFYTNHGFEVVKTPRPAERPSKATSHTEKKES